MQNSCINRGLSLLDDKSCVGQGTINPTFLNGDYSSIGRAANFN